MYISDTLLLSKPVKSIWRPVSSKSSYFKGNWILKQLTDKRNFTIGPFDFYGNKFVKFCK